MKWNLSAAALYEEAIRKQEGVIAAEGPLVCRTGHHTGRSPNDKFVVREPSSEKQIGWGKVNKPMEQAQWDALHADFIESLTDKELYVLDCYAGADSDVPPAGAHHHRVRLAQPVLPATCSSTIPRPRSRRRRSSPSSTRRASRPIRSGTARARKCVIALNFAKKLVLIGGTSYAGEMKKSIFSVLNYILPLKDVLSMHCSANIGAAGDVALFFGLSGTGQDDAVERSRRGS